ncbi:MAG: hypothetical protein K0R65_87 [Crocinitomicaceae bacterium]|jgi:hypothetical protein|nr:hypothetical protein [Crocinitomicaceae bacterium]
MMRKLHTQLLQKKAVMGKFSLLMFAALLSSGKAKAQWNDAPPSGKIAAPSNVRACGSYKLPALPEGNYFLCPGGNGRVLTPGHVITETQTLYYYDESMREKSFTITIDSMPAINFHLHGSRNSPGTVWLQATPDAGKIYWYDVPERGAALGTGTGFTTPFIAQTTTYFAQAVNGSCVSERTPVRAMVAPLVSGHQQGKGKKDGHICAPICNNHAARSVMKEETALHVNESLQSDFSLEAFPNPNTGDFMLIASHEGEYKIFGEQGKLIKTVQITKENELKIRVDGLKSGVYFVVGNIHNQTIINKVMVIQ